MEIKNEKRKTSSETNPYGPDTEHGQVIEHVEGGEDEKTIDHPGRDAV